MCAKGDECTYFHRVPTLQDDAMCEELFDCFGRQRHNKHRDDMSGVGSFMKPCRTLFVGGLLKHKYDSPQQHDDVSDNSLFTSWILRVLLYNCMCVCLSVCLFVEDHSQTFR